MLNLYYPHSNGKYISENRRIMVYDNQLLYKWQSNRFININDNISEEAMDVVGEYKLYNEQ